jgi:hypothetical protein
MRVLRTARWIGAASLVVGCAAVQAETVWVGAGWEEFTVGGVGSAWSRTFDYSSSSATVFRVVDGGLSGDRFQVTGLGTTSSPAAAGGPVDNNYLAAFVNSAFSRGTYLLSAGTYSIGGTTVLSPFGGGSFAAARADEVGVVTITPGAGWYSFGFANVDSAWNRAFLLNSSGPVAVTIVDGGCSGDEFFLDGLGATSVASFDPGRCVASNFDAALADSSFSRAVFHLPAGSYLITGLVTSSPYGGGALAGVRAEALPSVIFTDGFETGTYNAWSAVR